MTESLNAAREELAKVVDRLVSENPEVAEQYSTLFSDDAATGTQWISYGITQSDSIGDPAEPASDDFDDEDLGFLNDEIECEDGDVELVG
jgi:hypothetical protein